MVSSFPPTIGGIADYGKHMALHLKGDPRVEDVTVLADQAPGAPRIQRVAGVHVLRVWRRDGAGTGPALLRAVTTLRPDVVWFNLGLTMFGTRPIGAASGLIAPISATLLGYRTVVTLHELPALANLAALGLRTAAARLGAAVVPRLVLSADTVVVTLDRYRRFLVERYGAGNIRRIPHGAYGPPEAPGEPEQETALVFGTFGPHKEPGLVAEAVASLRRTRPGLRLVVAGTDHPRYPGFMSAYCAPEVQTFCPLTTNSSPTVSARVRSDARSEPEPGSVSPQQPSNSPEASRGMYFFFCSSLPTSKIWLEQSELWAATVIPTEPSTRESSSIAITYST